MPRPPNAPWYRVDKALPQMQRNRVWNAIQEMFMLNSDAGSLRETALPVFPYVAFRGADVDLKGQANSISALAEAAGALQVQQCPGHVLQRVLPARTPADARATTARHGFNDSQTPVLIGSLAVLILLVHGPPGTGKTKTITAVLDLWLPCVPADWALGLFSGSNKGIDMPARYLAEAVRANKLHPDSCFPHAAFRVGRDDHVTSREAKALTLAAMYQKQYN
ncbi:unnamed protein product [Prorocentrum cordatum]|uniref:RNA helicase n=1 Tax=Prorocentrum cordatum TaxID=2364126 RepID=A0ABN9R7U2_9DINO|nr:unnamed protein product [Polarella glacialis]